MAENIIWILIVVILAIAVLAFGIGLLGNAKGGATTTVDLGNEVADSLGGNLQASCRDWLGASNMYNAEDVLDHYKIPGRAEPYGTNANLDSCSVKMKEEALTVINAGKTDKMAADGPGVTACITACTSVKNCYDTIVRKNPGQGDSDYATKLDAVIAGTHGSSITQTDCT